MIINYVMRNKMARKERMSPVKHINMIQDKF